MLAYRRTLKLLPSAAAALFSHGLLAAVIDSGPVSIPIPATVDGVYLNLVTGVTGSSAASVPGWDLDPYASGGALTFFVPGDLPNHGVLGQTSEAFGIDPGASVSSSSPFTSQTVVQAGLFRSPGTRFAGLRFRNEATGTLHYGYVSIEGGPAPTGFPAFIRRYVYESTPGAAITVTAAPAQANWVALGPGPANNGQVEGITNRPVVGAVEALAAHPSNSNILYAGAVNGGIWRTNNATAAAPNWTRLGDSLNGMSIGALVLDASDASGQTLLAGVGLTSSLAGLGGTRGGLFRSTDGGANWTTLGAGFFGNNDIVGLGARGAILMVATTNQLFHSNSTGTAFLPLALDSGTLFGLPAGTIADFAGDSQDAYVVITQTSAGGAVGIYRSIGANGLSWNKTNFLRPDIDVALILAANVEIAARGNVIAVAVVGSNGRLANVYYSNTGGVAWEDLGVPTTVEGTAGSVGIHASSQGGLHLSVAIHPTQTNLVFVGGDRQPRLNEGGSPQTFPNSIGAQNFTGRLFRGDASLPAASRWTTLTHSGTIGNSAPHADSREIVFDASGTLIEGDDGGVYRRSNPTSSTGDWFSLNGDLQTSEVHSFAFDPVSSLVFSGLQDNGANRQTAANTTTFETFLQGDGADVTVEVVNATQSLRYGSTQNLGNFIRQTVNASGTPTGVVAAALTPTDAAPRITAQFYTPIQANRAAPSRIVLGGANGVYESFDRGDTTTRLSSTLVIPQVVGTPIIYGLPNRPDYLLIGAGAAGVFVRNGAPPAALTQINALANVNDLAIDPANARRVFAVTANDVRQSSNGGSTLGSVLGNLFSIANGPLRAMIYAPGRVPALVVAAGNGVFVARSSSGFTQWTRLGIGLPNVPSFELEYDRRDGTVMVGTLGRGIWRLPQALPDIDQVLFRDGFEP